MASDPGGTADRAREAFEGVGEVAWAGLNPAPDVPLNVPIGPHRRLFWAQTDLADFKAVKNGLGGTVNDAFLAVVAGALGRWLRSRGVRTEGMELRGLVPVSIRTEDEQHNLGQPDRRPARPAARVRARTRWSGCGSCARRCRASRSPSRRSAPR